MVAGGNGRAYEYVQKWVFKNRARGSQPTLERLVQIAHIFNIEVSELLSTENDRMIFLIIEGTNQSNNNYGYS